LALCSNTTGQYNVAVGCSPLLNNTEGTDNQAIGNKALCVNTTGSCNTAIGRLALRNNQTSSQNVAVGQESVCGNTTGGQNVGVGVYALKVATTGTENTAVGNKAGCNITTGTGNVILGREAGTDAVFNATTENNRLVLGNNNISNAYIKVALTVTSDLRDKTEIGEVPHGLEFVEKLKPVSFKFKKSRENPKPHGLKKYGFLAQDIIELEGSDNVIIDNENEENLKLTNSHLIPVLVNAIKELTARVKELENE
jgi:hypothetical protein